MQPVHPPGLAGLPLEPTVSIMGQARWKDTFPWRAIKDQGVVLAFGTDWPVSPLSPLHALHCALSRQPWGQGQPDQRLTLGEALDAYASAGSYALFTENLRGQIAVGMRADVVLLRGDVQGLAQRPDAVEIVGVYVDGEQA
jgi:predicted amidohydrolase YtcJ